MSYNTQFLYMYIKARNHKREKTCYLSFWEWLISLNMITSSCIQFPASNITVHFKAEKTSIVYTMPFFFMHSFDVGNLGWLYNSVIAKSAVTDTDVTQTPWRADLESADKKPYGGIYSDIWENFILIFIVPRLVYISSNNIDGFAFVHIMVSISCFLNYCHSDLNRKKS